MAEPSLSIVRADFDDADHTGAIVALVGSYARDADGNPRELPEDVRTRLLSDLRDHPTALVLLAAEGKRLVGIALCFVGYSTFAARPLVNVHDLVVAEDRRGRGIGRRLLEEVAERARALGGCKVTLEVHETNTGARALYRERGFRNEEHEGERVFFLEKLL